jgi:cobalt/nickel transport system permease protein
MVLVVSVTLVQKPWPLVGLFALVLALAISSRLALRRLLRVWLGVPLLSLAIILPATLNVVTHGPAILTLCHFAPGSRFGLWALPEALTITRTGLVVAGRFVLRSLTCVSLVQVLVATTGAPALLGALRRLGMPRVFGMVLTVSHRYLVELLRAAQEIHLAKLSRTIPSTSLRARPEQREGAGAAGSLRREQRWVAAGIGMLFRRTHRLAQEVHEAMLSRGYDGDLQIRPGPRLRLADWAWLGAVALVIIALILAERLT